MLKTIKIYALNILLFTLICKAIATCPSKCICLRDSIACIDQGLEDVPIFETIDAYPIVIDLSGNSLISIDIFDFSFERNTEVEELYLNHSQIIDIEDQVFDELTNLQELYLNHNNIKDIPVNIIVNNKNLIVLDLSNNLFERLPVINSTSLEFLALANSGISSVAEHSLNNLPNLKELLLEENKIQQLSTTLFDSFVNSFIVRLTYNAWRCNCDTVKLFEYLNSKKYTAITLNEPIQCLTEDKTFVDIYYSNGTTIYFKEKCKNNSNATQDITEGYKQINIMKDDQNYVNVSNKIKDIVKSDLEDTTKLEMAKSNRTINKLSYDKNLNKTDICSSDEYYDSMKIILFVTVPITFLFGMLFGCYLTFSYGLPYVKLSATESSKKLLSTKGGV